MNAARAAVAARGAMLVVALALAACTSGQGDRRDPKATAVDARWTTRIESGASGRDVPAPSAARTVVASVAIATGSSRATNFRIGRDLEQFVAPAAGIDLDVLATNGSADNLHRLADDPRVDLAIVQYDVLRAMSDEARGGDRRAARLIDPVRIVLPLYTEEIHFVVRRDSPLKTVDDIRGKRINLGVQGSGSALTATALYRRMFHAPVAPANASYLSDEQALAALTLDRSVDVVVVVAAQPAQLFSDMKSAGCRCAGDRGSPPRRARRPGTGARTRGRWPWRSSGRARSCPRPEDRPGTGSGPSASWSGPARPGTPGSVP